jgi:haloalkane dehalogenase
MLHGNPTWSFYYRNLVLALKDKYRTIVPDHIGCGLSDKPSDEKYNYTLSRRVADLEKLLDSLNIKNGINLVVHDWGGIIGFAYAVRHPETIKKIVVMNTSGFHLPQTKAFPFALWLGRNTKLGGYLIRKFNAFCISAVYLCCKKKPMGKDVREGFLFPYDSWDNRIAVHRFVQDIPLKKGDAAYDIVSEVEENLDKLKDKPMLICWGEKDFVFDKHFLEGWLNRFPEALVFRFPDAGHYVLEDEEQQINELMKNFFA